MDMVSRAPRSLAEIWMVALVAGALALGPGAAAADAEAGSAASAAAGTVLLGVSLAGGEFGKAPGEFGREYTYPVEAEFAYLAAKGLPLARLPIRWERVQKGLGGRLDETEMARLDTVFGHARTHGIRVLLDLHNYGRYAGQAIGTEAVPITAFADLWRRLAERYHDERDLFGYGLMNEPQLELAPWTAAAQAAVDAIRTVDRIHTITACGVGWSGAHSWPEANGGFLLRDPAGNLLYEAHQYFDVDHSGTYRLDYDRSGVSPAVGAERLQPFAAWLREHGVRGFIGEFGVPGDDPRWLVVLDRFLAAMRENGLGGTYWAAGPWWGDYPLSVEPRDGKDRPQMAVLQYHAAGAPAAAERPWLAAAAQAEAAARDRRATRAAAAALPAGPLKVTGGKGVYAVGARNESYHYNNEGSEFASEAEEEAGKTVRRITFRHRGDVAWVGVGLYFGVLDCTGYTGFGLRVRSDKPRRLEVKAYPSDQACYSGTFDVGTEGPELVIPFRDLRRGDEAFPSDSNLKKIEFQPSPDREGGSLTLGEFRLLTLE